jgi:hypothetical protein
MDEMTEVLYYINLLILSVIAVGAFIGTRVFLHGLDWLEYWLRPYESGSRGIPRFILLILLIFVAFVVWSIWKGPLEWL